MRAPSSASVVAVASRPLTYARDRPSVGITRRDDVLVVAHHEPALDACLGSSGANDRRIRAPADQQVDRFDHHRLACTGLARERGQARAVARGRGFR